MNCLYCKEIIGEDDRKRMVAFDRPYANLWVHRECVKLLDSYGVEKFIDDNADWFDQLVKEFGGIEMHTDGEKKPVKTKTTQVKRGTTKKK